MTMVKGWVESFDEKRFFGFIETRGGGRYFFHGNDYNEPRADLDREHMEFSHLRVPTPVTPPSEATSSSSSRRELVKAGKRHRGRS